MAIKYTPSKGEQEELDRLGGIWKAAIRNEEIWKARIDLLTDFITTPVISNAALNQRREMFNSFRSANSWFNWTELFGGVEQLANGNLNRTAYVNLYDGAKAATVKAKQEYLDFKAILDNKEVAVAAAQDETSAALVKSETTKYVVGGLGLIVVLIIAYKIIF